MCALSNNNFNALVEIYHVCYLSYHTYICVPFEVQFLVLHRVERLLTEFTRELRLVVYHSVLGDVRFLICTIPDIKMSLRTVSVIKLIQNIEKALA
jgi:hypothetical protein